MKTLILRWMAVPLAALLIATGPQQVPNTVSNTPDTPEYQLVCSGASCGNCC